MIRFIYKGFTIVEFLTVLAIAAIFTTLVVPGYKALIQNNKVIIAANQLTASFNLARMEAVKRGVPVAVCPAANSSFNTCGTSSQWSQGWIVFVDEDSDSSIDSASDLVKITQGIPSGAQVTSSSGIIAFDSAGFLSTGTGSFSLTTEGCTGNNARTVTISSSGRSQVAVAACN